MTADALTVVFFPEGAFGPTNNCVGIANVLLGRGARVVFVVEESFAGTLAAKGFEERLMRLTPAPAPEVAEIPGQYWKDFIRDTAPQFRKPTHTQIETLIKPIWQGLIDGAIYADARLREIFAEIKPDVIVEDNVVAFPAVVSAGVPWVRSISCNPLEAPDPALPPALSGLPTADRDRGAWDEFRRTYHAAHAAMHRDFSRFAEEHGCPPLPPDQFMYESPYLNLYVYPAELDYERSAPLAQAWHRLASSVRATEAPFVLPDSLQGLQGSGKLIYLSLGSLGSADIALMTRLIDLLGATEHRIIVSMGPQHELLTLRDNMYGAEFLPQTSLLPLVDLVITHGGNNTITECMHFGKPMIVLPLFWDQYDNAQRVHERGFGLRLPSYTFGDAEFYGAIDRLLGDTTLHQRMQSIAARIQNCRGTVLAADLIEQVAQEQEQRRATEAVLREFKSDLDYLKDR